MKKQFLFTMVLAIGLCSLSPAAIRGPGVPDIPPDTLLLLAPNGGEVLTAGSTYTISWSSTGSISDIIIEYSTNNGTDWNDVNTVPNTSSYDWLVPAVNSNQCLVRISDVSNPSISDTSDSVFIIRIRVPTGPGGGMGGRGPGTGPTPLDLEVTSEDIEFVPVPSEPCSPVTISATIWNTGEATATDVNVVFKDFDEIIGSGVIPVLGPNDSNTVSIEHTWYEASFRLITVIVDPNNVIAELDENNNSGSKVYQVGDVPEMDASIELTCSAPTGFPQGATAAISGQAIYNILIEGQPNYEYPVKGGSVTAQIIDCNGIQQELIELYTDTDGRFNVSFEVPCLAGDKFDVVITVTDDTLTGTLSRTFDVIEWKDIYVYSNDITFSNGNPADGETITIGATVHADAHNTYMEYNVPVTFYVYPPAGGKDQIEEIKTITQMAPGDSNTVSVTWTNTGEGEYYIEVSLEPNFSDDRNLNNRAIIRLTVGPPSPEPPTQPPTEPVKFDLWVYSEDVNFSDINPDLGESITIDALLHSKSDNTQTGPNVPVTFYAHHSSGETYQIGRTIMIEEMYPGDNHLVSTTWRNAAEGAYVIEAVLGPAYLDDNSGNNQATRELTVGNRAPAANAGQDQTVECACNTAPGTKVTLNGSGSSDQDGDPLTYTWTGPFLESPATGPAPIVTLSDGCPGDYVITLVVNDGKVNSLPDDVVITVEDTTPPSITCPADVTLECPADTSTTATGVATGSDTCGGVTITHSDVWVPVCGNTGTLTRTWTATDECGNSSSCVQTITVIDTIAPVISNLDADYLLAAVGQTVTFSAIVFDECDSSVDIVWNFGDGTAPSSNPSHIYGQPNIYNVTVTATDDCGNSSTDSIIIVVYDPSAGFTTGCGWFVPDAASFIDGVGVTDTVSKANFGFIVKYKKGADNPDGNLEFQYKAGDINLRSTDMEWLVVQSATKVRFKGKASINGKGLYTFKVTAEDNGGPGTGDWFKIEIWMGPDVDTENSPPMPKHKAQGFLGGGNVVVHTK